MSETKNNPHEGHRARVRETFRKNGIENMPDHNVLEFLLFYSVPRCDTNELAHRLISAFGSLKRVFEASPEQLMEIEGIGESSALLISSVPGLCRRYAECGREKKINLTESDEVKKYIISKFYGCRTEVFYMLCLDPLGSLINCCKIGEGSSSKVLVDKRSVVETALRCNADLVILAHNHPDGIPAPSKEDINLTSEFCSIFSQIGIRLADHLIVAGNDALSLASIEKFRPMFI